MTDRSRLWKKYKKTSYLLIQIPVSHLKSGGNLLSARLPRISGLGGETRRWEGMRPLEFALKAVS